MSHKSVEARVHDLEARVTALEASNPPGTPSGELARLEAQLAQEVKEAQAGRDRSAGADEQANLDATEAAAKKAVEDFRNR